MSKDFRFRKKQHVCTQKEYNQVRNHGRVVHCKGFVLQFLLIPSQNIRRLGAVASKRVGNSVKRSRAKRLLREIFRLNQHALPEGCDVVLIARNGIDRNSFLTLEQDFLRACKIAQKA